MNRIDPKGLESPSTACGGGPGTYAWAHCAELPPPPAACSGGGTFDPGLLAIMIGTEIIGGGPEDPLADAAVAWEAAEAAEGTVSAVEGETVVIGEDMAGRVIPTAESRGASVYSPPDAPPEQWMQNNKDWINQKMDEGCTILDCGAAPGRTNFPNATSPYYQMELDQIRQRSYSLYQKIPTGE